MLLTLSTSSVRVISTSKRAMNLAGKPDGGPDPTDLVAATAALTDLSQRAFPEPLTQWEELTFPLGSMESSTSATNSSSFISSGLSQFERRARSIAPLYTSLGSETSTTALAPSPKKLASRVGGAADAGASAGGA